MKEKYGILEKIRKEYSEVNDDLYMRIKQAIKFQSTAKSNENEQLIRFLPQTLKADLAFIVYKKYVQMFHYFKDKPKAFLAWICPIFHPIKVLKGGVVFEEGDLADQFFFITKGQASFVFQHSKGEFPLVSYGEGKKLFQNDKGKFFGDIEIKNAFHNVKRGKRLYSAVADEDLEMLSLNIAVIF